MHKLSATIFIIVLSAVTLSAGLNGNVLKFDGVDDYVNVAHDSSISLSTEWTMEVWIKPDTISTTYQAILSKSINPRAASLWLLDGFAEVWYTTDGQGGDRLKGTIPINSKEWTHLAVSFGTAGGLVPLTFLELYVNGVLDTLVVEPGLPDVSENNWTFGQRGDNNFWYAGEMDEVRIWNVARSASQINYYKDYNIRSDVDGLQGLWHFNDGIGAGRVWEETENKNHGSLFGAEIILSDSPIEALPANTLYLNGIDENVFIPYNSSLDITTEWTLETWIKPDTLADVYQALISKNVGPRPPSLWQFGSSIEVWFDGDSSSGMQAYSKDILKQGEWQHVAATYDYDQIKLYVNGEMDTSFAVKTNPFTNLSGWTIGQRGDNQFWYNGYMDEVRIWKRALDQNEIQQNMFNTQGPATGLLASFGFNQLVTDEVADVIDASGNENNGIAPAQTLVDSDTPVQFAVTAIEPAFNRVAPKEFLLLQNYPNPFNPSTTIPFSLKKSSEVSLKIYDTLGRKVLDVFNKNISSGDHRIIIDLVDLPSGTYFYQLKTGSFMQTKRMLLIK